MNETEKRSAERDDVGRPAQDSASEQTPPADGQSPARGKRSAAADEQPVSGGEPSAAADDDARTTEPGAWAAQHARRTRAQRPGRRSRRPVAPAVTDDAVEPVDDDGGDVIVAAAAPPEVLLQGSPAPVSDEALAAATADEEVTPARRRRRGRRGRGVAGKDQIVQFQIPRLATMLELAGAFRRRKCDGVFCAGHKAGNCLGDRGSALQKRHLTSLRRVRIAAVEQRAVRRDAGAVVA